MRHPEVKFLYKYSSLSINGEYIDYVINSLKNQTVWFSNPSYFNDPFDSNIRINNTSFFIDEPFRNIFDYIKKIDADAFKMQPIELLNDIDLDQEFEKTRQILDEILQTFITSVKKDNKNEILDKFKEHFLEKIDHDIFKTIYKMFIDTLGVLSLCETPTNPLMWAHYSDSHKGFCIEYKRSENNFLGNSRCTFPVRYSEKYPTITYDDILSTIFNMKSGQDITFENLSNLNGKDIISEFRIDESVIGSILLTKSSYWEYEKEWRSIHKSNTNIPLKINKIIFGLKMPKKDKEKIVSILGDSVNYSEVEIIPDTFSLKIN